MKRLGSATRTATGVRQTAMLTVLLTAASGCGPDAVRTTRNDHTRGSAMGMTITSPAFQEGQTIPVDYTGVGKDISPPLKWSDPPKGTTSLAIICDDPDAPRGTWVHWVVFNLPADLRGLEKGVPSGKVLENGGKQGKNDFGAIGYGGPAPPPGKPHRYFFTIYALDTSLDVPSGSTKAEVLEAMQGHILAEGQLMGTFGR